MRNLLILSSLALVAAAGAQQTSTASSSVIASYAVTGGVSTVSVTGFEYDFGTDNNYSGDDTGAAIFDPSHSTTHSHVAGTNLFALTSASTVAQGSTDFSKYGDAYQQTFVGYTYDVKFDGGATGGTVRFDVTTLQTYMGAAYSPIGQFQFGAVPGTFVGGAYAEAYANAGVAETTTDPLGQALPADQRRSFGRTAYNDVPLVSTPTFQGTGSQSFSATFTLLANEARSFRVYTSTSAYTEYYNPAPVPEPSVLAALGLGALALLRRRRRA